MAMSIGVYSVVVVVPFSKMAPASALTVPVALLVTVTEAASNISAKITDGVGIEIHNPGIFDNRGDRPGFITPFVG